MVDDPLEVIAPEPLGHPDEHRLVASHQLGIARGERASHRPGIGIGQRARVEGGRRGRKRPQLARHPQAVAGGGGSHAETGPFED